MKPVEGKAQVPSRSRSVPHSPSAASARNHPRIRARCAVPNGEQVRLLGRVAQQLRAAADLPVAISLTLETIRQTMALQTVQLVRAEGNVMRRLAIAGTEWPLEDQDPSLLLGDSCGGSAGLDVRPSAVNVLWLALSEVGATRWLLGARCASDLGLDRGEIQLLTAAGSILAGSLDRIQLLSDLRESQEGALRALTATLACRDRYTGQHVDAVSLYAERLAQQLGLASEALQSLRMGSILHDIGKIGISDAILQKSGPLSEYEMAQMRQHTVIGAQIVRHVQQLEGAIPIILYHHERWDGAGYPSGLASEQIPMAARVVAVVDSFDAITSTRPYRKARTEAEAFQILREGRGTHYDPRVADAFLDLMG